MAAHLGRESRWLALCWSARQPHTYVVILTALSERSKTIYNIYTITTDATYIAAVTNPFQLRTYEKANQV